MSNPLQAGFLHRGNSSSHSRPQTFATGANQPANYSPTTGYGLEGAPASFADSQRPRTLDSDQQPFQQPYQRTTLATG